MVVGEDIASTAVMTAVTPKGVEHSARRRRFLGRPRDDSSDAPIPLAFERDAKPEKEDGPQTSYAVSSYPNVGTFYLEGKTGTCLYTWPVINGKKFTYIMYKANLNFVGSDGSGNYWHYQFPLAGGLNWYFPKRTDTPWLPTVWTKIEAPESKPVQYGTPIIFPTMIDLAK